MGGSFRLMTANLLNGKADPGHVAEILDRHRPDLCVIQEMGHDIVPVIADRYPHHDLKPASNHEGRGVASRLDAELGSAPLPWRWVAWARVTIEGRPVVVATTHIRNPIAFPWWTSVRLRGEQLDGLFAWADARNTGDAIILAGDMNASPAWPLYRRLSGRWTDLLLELAKSSGTKPSPTWGWRPGWPRLLRIDHVFGKGARAVTTSVEPVRGSDHAALLVDVELL